MAADGSAGSQTNVDLAGLATGPRDVAKWLLVIGGNRLELLAAELESERDHLLHLMLLVMGMAVFALLSGIVGTAAIVLALWAHGPVLVLAVLASMFIIMMLVIRRFFTMRSRAWRSFAASIDQLRKDREELVGRLP